MAEISLFDLYTYIYFQPSGYFFIFSLGFSRIWLVVFWFFYLIYISLVFCISYVFIIYSCFVFIPVTAAACAGSWYRT